MWAVVVIIISSIFVISGICIIIFVVHYYQQKIRLSIVIVEAEEKLFKSLTMIANEEKKLHDESQNLRKKIYTFEKKQAQQQLNKIVQKSHPTISLTRRQFRLGNNYGSKPQKMEPGRNENRLFNDSQLSLNNLISEIEIQNQNNDLENNSFDPLDETQAAIMKSRS